MPQIRLSGESRSPAQGFQTGKPSIRGCLSYYGLLSKLLESLNDLSIVTRYPEDIDGLVRAFKKDRAVEYFKRTREFLRWLKKDLRLKK
jgi:hypothetical protein